MEITSIISQHVKALNRDAMCALSLENFPMTAVICTRDTIEIISLRILVKKLRRMNCIFPTR